ncbi:hypothetical protein Busp01_51780 [Trinickia caryophylli]|nr:hypothetical protein Busp01_51780 [Trinickia caryophylli]
MRVVKAQEARARLVMERERIPKPLRTFRCDGALPHLELNPTLAAGIHDKRFSIEIKQRIKAGIAHVRLLGCYHRIITSSIISLPRRTTYADADADADVARLRAVVCLHTPARTKWRLANR